MSAELKQLVEAGNKTIEAIRAEVDTLKSKSDPLAAEKVAKMEADLAATLAAKSAAELQLKALENRLAEVETKANRPGQAGAGAAEVDEHKTALVEWLRNPADAVVNQKMYEFSKKSAEFNTLTGQAGGYAVPKVIAAEIARVAQDANPFRGIARVVTVGTTDYNEVVDLGGAGYEWVGETDTRNRTNTPDLASIKPTFGSIVAYPQATIEAIQDSFFDSTAWMVDSAVERFAQAEGEAFMSGNGVNKPTGLLTVATSTASDASRAFGTAQHIVTGDAAGLGANPFDQLLSLVFGTKAAYRAQGRFLLNSATLASYAKVKNAAGDYIYQVSLAAGSPDRLLGYAVTVAEQMPNVAADAMPVAFGDFKRGYLIADRAGLVVIRDNITLPGYVRVQVIKRVGGCVKDTNAFKFLKVSA